MFIRMWYLAKASGLCFEFKMLRDPVAMSSTYHTMDDETANAAVSILVIDTKPEVSHEIHDLLYRDSPEAYSVHWCSNIREALGEPRDNVASLIFLHVNLAHNEHKNYLRLARKNRFPIPIVLIGESLSLAEECQLIAEGASDYLNTSTIDIYNLQRSIRYARDLKAREVRIDKLVNFDHLTGTPTRQYFYELLARRVVQATEMHQQVGLLLLNIDGFKKVSNSFGHHVGDLTAKEIVARLNQAMERGQELARIADDQFAICITGEGVMDDINMLVERIRQLQRIPYQQQSRQVVLGCSIGCAIYPDTANNMDELLCHAGTAMHQAKKERGCSLQLYSEGLRQNLAQQISLEPELMMALRQHQFVLFYQPRIDLEKQRIIGAEALIRWQHPTRGLLPPNEFIPLAEKTGLIVPMGYWVVYKACKDLEMLNQMGLKLERVGINLSFRQFQDDTLLPTIQRIIRHTGVDPEQLEFELTETAMALNEQHVGHCIQELSKLGLAFSLDDFGTGYSSFAHLQKLPINTLKIDRSFISGVTDNADDAEIVRAIINLAHNLRKDVIAEGAETEGHIQFLRDNHCDQVQGYFFSPPIDFERFCGLLSNEQKVRAISL